MSHTIGIGESIVITAREVTEEMHDRRVALGLAPKNELENGALAKILRAYPRPRDQETVEIEVREDGSEVKVTALAKGHATIDVIDEISEPAGHDTEVYVVRKPQLKGDAVDEAPANPLAHLNVDELAAIGMKRAEFAVEGGAPLTPVNATEPAPMEVKSDL